MSDRLLVATRKGLFDLRRGGAGWRIERTSFVGDPVSMVLRDPRDGTLYAAQALGHFGVKMRRSRDDGKSWDEIPAPALPKIESDDKAPSVALIWSLETGGAGRPGRLWAGVIPAALFRSDDAGDSWQRVDSLWERPERKDWFGGGYDAPGLHSICVDPRNPDRVTVGISCGGVWLTDDAGVTWRLTGKGMKAEYMPPGKADDPNIQDPHRVVQSPTRPDVFWTQHHSGVFRSDDHAASWSEITAIKPSKFGFAVAVHPADADTAWFVPGVKDECRVPVDGAFVVARTQDGGRSFETLREGLPQANAYDLVYRHGLDVDTTGKLLAMGSTTGNLWTSDTGGERWSLDFPHLPPIACVRFA